MNNPFCAGDQIETKIKGQVVKVEVIAIFNNEVQVKTEGGVRLWRTMHTVWKPGEAAIPKPAKAAVVMNVPPPTGDQVTSENLPAEEAHDSGADPQTTDTPPPHSNIQVNGGADQDEPMGRRRGPRLRKKR